MKALVNNKWEFNLGEQKESALPGALVPTAPDAFHVLIGTNGYNAVIGSINKEEKSVQLKVNGQDFEVKIQTAQDLLLQKLGISASAGKKLNHLKAPMPGLLLKIIPAEGDSLKKGDPLCILEAMKMENILKAPADLTIKKILVSEKQAVEKNQILMEFL